MGRNSAGTVRRGLEKNVQVSLSPESPPTPTQKRPLLNPRAICGCKLLLDSKPSYAFLFKTFNNVCSRFAIYPVSESRESFPYFFFLSL